MAGRYFGVNDDLSWIYHSPSACKPVTSITWVLPLILLIPSVSQSSIYLVQPWCLPLNPHTLFTLHVSQRSGDGVHLDRSAKCFEQYWILDIVLYIIWYKNLHLPFSNGYSMLDASKAFDKVNHNKRQINHNKLFGQLIDRGYPAFIVCILYHWYGSQQFTIRSCQGFSSFFTVSNGVKQGGILSPSFQCIHTWMT